MTGALVGFIETIDRSALEAFARSAAMDAFVHGRERG